MDHSIGEVERCALQAWPAAEVQLLDGWYLRFNGGITGRANSVWPNESTGVLSLEQRLATVDEFYRQRGLPIRYQICPAAQPENLDAFLGEQGYASIDRTCVQVAGIEAVIRAVQQRGVGAMSVTISAHLSQEWFTTYSEAEQMKAYSATIRQGILERILPTHAFAVLSVEGLPIATGLSVYQQGWLGLFCLATRSAYRRQGAATAILRELAQWGREQGAEQLYLQVAESNTTARALYESLGFQTLYIYHYRIMPLQTESL